MLDSAVYIQCQPRTHPTDSDDRSRCEVHDADEESCYILSVRSLSGLDMLCVDAECVSGCHLLEVTVRIILFYNLDTDQLQIRVRFVAFHGSFRYRLVPNTIDPSPLIHKPDPNKTEEAKATSGHTDSYRCDDFILN
jgi:hypothetical protein